MVMNILPRGLEVNLLIKDDERIHRILEATSRSSRATGPEGLEPLISLLAWTAACFLTEPPGIQGFGHMDSCGASCADTPSIPLL